MRTLILGGTRFLGRHLTESALRAGHDVTLFNRGRSAPGLWPEVEELRGDRDGELTALKGRAFDVVIDTSGYVPRTVRASAEAVAGSVSLYAFVSSISVYADLAGDAVDESTRLAALEDPDSEDVDQYYGELKAACEREVTALFDDRALVVRPGLIVGPHDPTDRFTYWVERVERGGDVLAPSPSSAPVQFIDVRDLADWIVDVSAAGLGGTFNATGPGEPMTFGELLERCKAATGSDARFAWTDPERLLENGVRPWTELPLWLPDPTDQGLLRIDISAARRAGLSLRPVDDTVVDTLAWSRSRPNGPRAAGLAADKESALLGG